MKYKRLMGKIMEQLSEYKGVVDALSTSYQAEIEKREAQLEDMKDTYTESYISENRKHWEPKKDYTKAINAAREKHQRNAFVYLDQIKGEMDEYFSVPVYSGFSTTVTAIKALGLTLSDREFEVLQGAAGGYFGLRLLNELAVSRTKTGQETELENGEVKRKEKETKIPYGGVELPDIEKAYDSLQDVKNAVNIAFEGYCGEGYELKDIVFPLSKATEKTNAKLAATYGVQPQKQMRDAVTISKMATSTKCFDENHSAYAAFSEMMGGLEATTPRPERKTTLTDSDKALIDALIDPRYPSLAQDKVVKIASLDERLGNILALDRRYKDYAKEALEEVSGNE